MPPDTRRCNPGSPALRSPLPRSHNPVLQTHRELRAIHRRRVLLRPIKLLRLQRACLSVLHFRHVEENRRACATAARHIRPRAGCCRARTSRRPTGPWSLPARCRRCAPARISPSHRARRRTLSRCASRTRSSPPTSAVSDTLFGALNVASHPARCSIVCTVSPVSLTYSRAV